MKRVIGVFASIAATFYLAIIYRSDSFVFLGYAELITVVLLLVYQLLFIGKLFIFIETPLKLVQLKQPVPVRIVVRSYRLLPTGKIALKIRRTDISSRKRKAIFFTTVVVRGKDKKEKGYAEAVLQTYFLPEHVGKVNLEIYRAWSYDLLGLLAIPIRKKKREGQNELFVLPEQYEMPVTIDRNVYRVTAELELYLGGRLKNDLEQPADIRGYLPGDKIRSIHWKLSAKTDDLVVQEKLAEKSCIVLFYLEMLEEERELGSRWGFSKERAKKTEAFLSILLSLSTSLLRQNCMQYVIWYDGLRKEVVRYLVETDGDVYALLLVLDGLWKKDGNERIQEVYQKMYDEFPNMKKIVLNGKLQLICGEEKQYAYQAEKIEEQLTSQEVLL